jgi:hypothetical protein
LDKVRPEVIVGIQPPSELCIAAKKKGILIADLQHGIVSDEGYYGLAHRAQYGQEGWPSCVLCWDRTTEEWIRNHIGAVVSTRVIGHPWAIRFMHPHESDDLVSACTSKGMLKDSERLTILVTLLWDASKYAECHTTGIHLGLLDFIKKHGRAFDWWLRVHPMRLQGSERAKTFTGLTREFSNCESVSWEQCSDLPLPQVLKQVDLHMTANSAVTIEAGWFGVRTALLSENVSELSKWFAEEIRIGTAEIVSADRDNIERWIERNAKLVQNSLAADCLNGQLLDGFISDIASGGASLRW